MQRLQQPAHVSASAVPKERLCTALAKLITNPFVYQVYGRHVGLGQ